MNKILHIDQAMKIGKELQKQNKTIVLAGGCFDILHIGHVQFLQKAKEQGDTLIILLESDEKIRSLKGEQRPVHVQADRAAILTALSVVDFVILLPAHMTDKDYDSLIFTIHPAIIATTKDDSARAHKERQARKLGIPVADVIQRIENHSTSRIARHIDKGL